MMKRPSANTLMIGLAVAAVLATVCVGIGQTEEAGHRRPDIWSNAWIVGAIVIAAICTILFMFSGMIYLLDHRWGKKDVPGMMPQDNSAGTNNTAVTTMTNPEAYENGSQESVIDESQSDKSGIGQGGGASALVAASCLGIALVAGIVVGVNSCTSIGSTAADTGNLPGSMPQGCTATGPVVFVVSGRQNSPAPYLTGSMATAAVRAIRNGASIGLVDLDGNPQLVAAHNFSGIVSGDVDRRAVEDQALYMVAKEVSGIRAKSAHADVLDALEAAGRAVHAACSHGGSVFLADSGLQDTGQVNFRKLALLHTSPAEIVALLKQEDNLPDLKGISVELVGIGDTAPPQQELTIAEHKKLVAIWSAVAQAGGAKVVVDSTQRDGGAPQHVPPVQLVPIE